MRTAAHTVGHARLVEQVVSGQRSAQLDVRVRESWRRCLSDYQLSPDQSQHPAVVSVAQLRQRRERADPLCSIARVEMAGLARLLNAPVGVMLTITRASFSDIPGGEFCRDRAPRRPARRRDLE